MPKKALMTLIAAASIILAAGCGKSADNTQEKVTDREVKEDKMIETKTDVKHGDTKEMTEKNIIRNVEIKTKGMSCSHCENSVKTEINKLNGIVEVTADAKTNIVRVKFDAGKTDIRAIQQAIDDAGYSVVETVEK
jgi:copper chaperone